MPPVRRREQSSMTDTVTQHRRNGAFFGRRKGHALRDHQKYLFEALLPQIGLDLTRPPPADVSTLFPPGVTAVHLEIGFGGAEHLLAQAAANPGTGYLGSEAYLNGMAKALAGIERQALNNVRLHFEDAVPLLDWLPPASLARIDLLYPDPWPKKRHWKRRFVQEATIAKLARVLRPGGEFRFASDIPDYVDWTLQRLLRTPDFVWTAQCADDWRQPWPGFVRTRYEAKAIREGRTPCYLIFRRL